MWKNIAYNMRIIYAMYIYTDIDIEIVFFLSMSYDDTI